MQVYVKTYLVCQPHSAHLSSKAQESIDIFFLQVFFCGEEGFLRLIQECTIKVEWLLSGSAFQYLLSPHIRSSNSNCPVKKQQ